MVWTVGILVAVALGVLEVVIRVRVMVAVLAPAGEAILVAVVPRETGDEQPNQTGIETPLDR